MKGIPCAGKSTLVEDISKRNKAIIISTDNIRRKNNLADNDISAVIEAFQRIRTHLINNENVVFDSTNINMKSIYRYLSINHNIDSELLCEYVITHPYLWIENAQKRINTIWDYMSLDDLLMLRKRCFEELMYPFPKLFKEVNFHIRDIKIDKSKISKFKEYYRNNYDVFLNDTEKFVTTAIDKNILQDVIPELYKIVGFDQKNSHHTLTLDKHTFKVCENLPKTEEWKWIGLLHDLGKLVDGIGVPKKTNKYEYTYKGHAGASAELAICILNRLGFTKEFMDKVVPIINLHMYIPYDEELTNKQKRKIEDYYDSLVLFRQADSISK